MSYDKTGQGSHPVLGRGKPVGLAQAGGPQMLPAQDTDIPKVARPGGTLGHKRVSAGGEPPKVARPGKAGSIGGGLGVNRGTPDW